MCRIIWQYSTGHCNYFCYVANGVNRIIVLQDHTILTTYIYNMLLYIPFNYKKCLNMAGQLSKVRTTLVVRTAFT